MAKTNTTGHPDLDNFIDLALQGRFTGSSSGEKAARKLALAAIEHSTILDDKAITGLVKFLTLAKLSPTTARDLIQGW